MACHMHRLSQHRSPVLPSVEACSPVFGLLQPGFGVSAGSTQQCPTLSISYRVLGVVLHIGLAHPYRLSVNCELACHAAVSAASEPHGGQHYCCGNCFSVAALGLGVQYRRRLHVPTANPIYPSIQRWKHHTYL